MQPGDALLVDDGLVRLEALASDGVRVTCRVIEGGEVSDHKGINLPGVPVSAPALTQKDLDDLRLRARAGRGPGGALVRARRVRRRRGAARPWTGPAGACRSSPSSRSPRRWSACDDIVDAFDGLMVARGDLGVEMPLEQVPLVQKRAVRLAREHGKPVIVATQMLESMVGHTRPTRAEVSDVANAVLDGADALMLTGRDRDRALPGRRWSRPCGASSWRAETEPAWPLPPLPAGATAQQAVARAAAEAARALGARALVAFTRTGSTVRTLASHREPVPLYAFTSEPRVRSQLSRRLGRGDLRRARRATPPTRWSRRWTGPCSSWAAAWRAS